MTVLNNRYSNFVHLNGRVQLSRELWIQTRRGSLQGGHATLVLQYRDWQLPEVPVRRLQRKRQ